ncbi:MAG: carbon storage regulator [Proteobacteria bacterium]|nr:carbon storage regulator [Pseudomonadota bacterium]
MLTLTRKPEESIIIGEGESRIEVTVKEIRRNQVRIGIQAPEHVRIFRKELYEKAGNSEEVDPQAAE